MTDQGAMTDEDRLRGYVEVWWQAIDDFTRVLEDVPVDAWQTPTDLPGWNVHDIAAHTAHLEGGLVGVPHDQVDIGEPTHVRGMMGSYTEQGVVGRKDRSPDELINEIRESATKRHTQLLAEPPTDATATADGFAALVGWSWERLLRNRPLDVWMHEQDVRRAVGQPGGLDSPAAQHAADYLLESMALVVGKRVSPPAGTSVLLKVAGSTPYAVSVGDDGRARPLADLPADPTVTLSLSREDFIVAAGGRREPAEVTVEGDQELGAQVLAKLAVTP
jgi:uncharacterized protein (TIGR03083 family)